MRVFTFHLLALLADLTHTASKNRDLPGLAAIELHTSRGEFGDEPGSTDLLAGASTDQFTAGHTYVPCDGQLSGPVLVPVDDAKRIVAVFRSAAKNELHAVEIHHDGNTLRISEDPNLIDDGLQLRVALHPLDEFPLGVYRFLQREQKHVVDDRDRGAVDAVPRTLMSGAILEPFVKVGKRRGKPLRIYRTHQDERWIIEVGDTYRGLALPIRAADDEQSDPQRPATDVHAPELPDEGEPEQQHDPADAPGLFDETSDDPKLVDA